MQQTSPAFTPALLFGATGGAAIGVILSVWIGTLPGGPWVLPLLTAIAGVAVHLWVMGRIEWPRWAVVAGIGLWSVLVLVALVYVVAAVAISNFE